MVLTIYQTLFQCIQFSSVAQSCLILCDPMNRSTPGLPVHHQLKEFTQTHVHWIGDAIQPSHPLSSPSPTFNLSNESALRIRWPKYWSFSFNISPSNAYSGLISLGLTGWISFQSKGLSRVFSNTIVQKHQFFSAQLSLQSNSHIPYITTGKTIALTRWTFVGKVMSLLLNILSRLVITFLPGNKCLLISSCTLTQISQLSMVNIYFSIKNMCTFITYGYRFRKVFWFSFYCTKSTWLIK